MDGCGLDARPTALDGIHARALDRICTDHVDGSGSSCRSRLTCECSGGIREAKCPTEVGLFVKRKRSGVVATSESTSPAMNVSASETLLKLVGVVVGLLLHFVRVACATSLVPVDPAEGL